MIYTLTMNPAIDLNITSKGLQKKSVNRTFDETYTPNGKGVNVSYVLHKYACETKIIGIFGGFSGTYVVDESKRKGVDVKAIWIEEFTRINVFLNDGDSEYKFVNQGPFVSEASKYELLEILKTSKDMKYLSINGSTPRGIDLKFYKQILDLCKKKNVKIILDTSSTNLSKLLKYKPYLIKPNDDEMEMSYGFTTNSEEEIIFALKEVHKLGAQNILLTLGEKGSYFYDGKDIYKASAVEIKLLSSACAGDAFLGGFLSIYTKNEKHVVQALKRASALGANVAESNGLGLMDKVEEYSKQVEVVKLGGYSNDCK